MEKKSLQSPQRAVKSRLLQTDWEKNPTLITVKKMSEGNMTNKFEMLEMLNLL